MRTNTIEWESILQWEQISTEWEPKAVIRNLTHIVLTLNHIHTKPLAIWLQLTPTPTNHCYKYTKPAAYVADCTCHHPSIFSSLYSLSPAATLRLVMISMFDMLREMPHNMLCLQYGVHRKRGDIGQVSDATHLSRERGFCPHRHVNTLTLTSACLLSLFSASVQEHPTPHSRYGCWRHKEDILLGGSHQCMQSAPN